MLMSLLSRNDVFLSHLLTSWTIHVQDWGQCYLYTSVATEEYPRNKEIGILCILASMPHRRNCGRHALELNKRSEKQGDIYII